MKLFQLFAGWGVALMLWGCVEQEPARPTEDDIRVIKQNILTQVPQMKYKVNAELEGKVTYLGMDVDKEVIKPGQPFNVTHYWKVHKPVEGWQLFVHLNGENKQGFVNADHKPIGGRYPVSQWKAGEIIRDEHRVTLPADWKSSKVTVYTGLWKGPLRMSVKGPSDGENRIRAAVLPVGASAQPQKPKQLVAIKAAKPITVDGKLDEEVWSKAPSTGPFVETMTGAPSPLKTEAKVAYDDKYLYIAFENEDEDVWSDFKERDDKLWTQEAVEVFIDANGDGKDYVELQVSPRNVIFDSYLPAYRKNQNDWNSKMKTAVAVDGTLNKREDKDKGWTVEMAIPWEDTKGRGSYELTLPPKVGDSWRLNFFRLDLPQKKPQLAVAWSAPLVGDFHKLDRFGTIVFGDEEGKAPSAAAVVPGAVAPAKGPAAAAANPPPNAAKIKQLQLQLQKRRMKPLQVRRPQSKQLQQPAKTGPAAAQPSAPAPATK